MVAARRQARLGGDLEQMLGCLWPEQESFEPRFYLPRPGRRPAYVPLPNPKRASLLVPAGPASATRSALRSYKSPTTAAGRARMRIVASVAALGLARLAPTQVVVGPDGDGGSFVGHLAQLYGQEVVVSIHFGPPRANRKPVLQVMSRTGQTIGYAKVGTTELTRRRVASEVKALTFLAEVGPSELSWPGVVGSGTWKGCAYLLLDTVETWSAEGVDSRTRRRAANALARCGSPQVRRLRESPWWVDLLAGLAALPDAEAAVLLSHAREVERRAGGRLLTFGAAHGDWTPWNMATHAGQAVVWDWERFSTDVPVGFDEQHYALQAAVRLHGSAPRAAIESVTPQAVSLAAANGAGSDGAEVVWVLYLLSLGERYLRDGQARAGARRGPVSSWLLPALPPLVDGLERA